MKTLKQFAKLAGVTAIAATLAIAPATTAVAKKGAKPPKAKITVAVVAPKGSGAYYFDGTLGEFSLRRVKNAHSETTFEVMNGKYTIRQVAAATELKWTECSDETATVKRHFASFKVRPGADITCTFYN